MSALQQGRHTRRAQPRVVARIGGKRRGGLSVGRVGHDAAHRLTYFTAHQVRRAAEELLRDRVQHHREVIRLDRQQRLREIVDRILLHGYRGVTARVGRGEVEGEKLLFRGLHVVGDLATVPFHSAAALIERVGSVDQVTVLCEQELDAVARSSLFIRGQRQHDVAVGYEALSAHANEVGDIDRRLVLVVGDAASVVVVAPLQELERVEIGAPVLG